MKRFRQYLKRIISAATLLVIAGTINAIAQDSQEPGAPSIQSDDFLVQPYVQFGEKGQSSRQASLEILWLTRHNKSDWTLEYRSGQEDWTSVVTKSRQVSRSVDPIFVCSAQLDDLKLGAPYEYRVKKDGSLVFASHTHTKKHDDDAYRFVVAGDLGAGSAGQRKVAFQMYTAKPDFVVVPGDIVYNYGLLSDYLRRFFPVYNADYASPTVGAPLIRTIPFVTVLGNHDIALTVGATGTDLNRFIDALAYFYLWAQPLNGPLGSANARNVPPLVGKGTRKSAFEHAAGKNFPRMANFSFDYGNSHWLVLDANYYMDWSTPSLRKWVESDLTSARDKTWRFVTFHQPGFSCDYAHFKEQRMRLLCDIFEECGVDVVFSGHAHNYQRSFPLSFKIYQAEPDGTVHGELLLDREFDGEKKTSPEGVLYIVSGAGGARLYRSATEAQQRALGDFTAKFIADVHSFTVCDVNGEVLDLKQISQDGNIIDQIRLTKHVRPHTASRAARRGPKLCNKSRP